MSNYTKNDAIDAFQDMIILETIKASDSGKSRLGGACRLPIKTADSGKIRLGGACRLPLRAD